MSYLSICNYPFHVIEPGQAYKLGVVDVLREYLCLVHSVLLQTSQACAGVLPATFSWGTESLQPESLGWLVGMHHTSPSTPSLWRSAEGLLQRAVHCSHPRFVGQQLWGGIGKALLLWKLLHLCFAHQCCHQLCLLPAFKVSIVFVLVCEHLSIKHNTNTCDNRTSSCLELISLRGISERNFCANR